MNSTSSMGSSREMSTIQNLVYLSVAGIVYFMVALFLLHQLSPEFDIRTRFLSEYKYGPYDYLLSSGLLALGTGSILLTYILFYLLGAQSPLNKAGLILLGLWGVALVLEGILPIASETDPGTLSGRAHVLVSMLASVSFIVSSLLLSLIFKRTTCLERISRPALLLAALIFLSFLLSKVADPAIQGLIQRLFISCCVGWLLLISISLCSTSYLNKIYNQSR